MRVLKRRKLNKKNEGDNKVPDFPEANIVATIKTGYDPKRQRFSLSVTLHPVQIDEEKAPVRVLTPPDDLHKEKQDK